MAQAGTNDTNESGDPWKESQGNKTKLRRDLATKLKPARVEDRWNQKSHSLPLPNQLKEGSLNSICTPGREGVQQSSFTEKVRALAELFIEDFADETYGDVADNPEALDEVCRNTKIIVSAAATSDPVAQSTTASNAASTTFSQRFQLGILSGIVIGVLFTSVAWLTLAPSVNPVDAMMPTDQLGLSELAVAVDPSVFYGASKGLYNVARVNHNKAAEYTETDFVTEVKSARSRFDFLANNAGVVNEVLLTPIEEGLQRGVQYRLVLSDYRQDNEKIRLLRESMGLRDEEILAAPARSVHDKLAEFINRIHQDKSTNPQSKYIGDIELRWNTKFLFNTMWIRDSGQEDAVAHVGLHFHRPKDNWPSIRVSRRIAPEMIANVEQEFGFIFNNALPMDAIPTSAAE